MEMKNHPAKAWILDKKFRGKLTKLYKEFLYKISPIKFDNTKNLSAMTKNTKQIKDRNSKVISPER